MKLPPREFEEMVREAVATLPDQFLRQMDNVDVLVSGWPTREQRRAHDLGPGETLFGLYEGVPLTHRDYYNMVPPDVIIIFQGPIQEACSTPEELVRQVQETVVHEVAHHFGISDAQLDEWGVG